MHPGQLGRHRDDEQRRIELESAGHRSLGRGVPTRLALIGVPPARRARPGHDLPAVPAADPALSLDRSALLMASRGSSSWAFANASSAVLASADNRCGTDTSTVTMRSPVTVLRCTPAPFTRNLRPDAVPAGTRSRTDPDSVGTVRSVPSASSGNVTGTVSVRLSPARPNSS